MTKTPLTEQQKQELYRDARRTGKYGDIWQNVGKCAFCDLKEKYIVLEENGIALTVSVFAYIDGHMLIIPRRHIESPKEFTPEEWETVRKFMYLAKKLIKKVHGIAGLQFIQKDGRAAQSTVGHIHYHAIPFDAPDLTAWHYRTLANTPLENANLYKKEGKKLATMAAKYDEKYAQSIAATSKEAKKPYDFDWGDVAFGSKKPIDSLKATFFAAPREVSDKRFAQLVKTYLPKGNIVLGIAKEPYVDGFEDQPQWRMLQQATIQKIVGKVNQASPKHKIYTLHYFQRETKYIFEKLTFSKIVLVRGSWKHTFHTRPEYYTLVNRRVNYEMVSPFVDEAEAQAYEQRVLPAIEKTISLPKGVVSAEAMGQAASAIARFSYENAFQTGVALGKKTNKGYKLLSFGFNKVVPFQTYAMHYGASREVNFTPPNDLNHYDTIHAEVDFILRAQREKTDLKGTTLFINLLPCPACARMFSETDIEEFVYNHDHSGGYAIKLLEAAGKKVRRITVE